MSLEFDVCFEPARAIVATDDINAPAITALRFMEMILYEPQSAQRDGPALPNTQFDEIDIDH